MKKEKFEKLEWHDAILKSIIIDKSNSNYQDNIEISIIWPSGIKSKLIFKDVYHANFSLNFGVLGNEIINDASVIDGSDIEISRIKNMWSKHYEGINNIKGFEIITLSTASTIRIFALSFILVDL